MRRVGQDEITQFFRQMVVAINEALGDHDISDDVAWELARQLHQLWRDALRRASGNEERKAVAHPKGHPAMEDLIQMIDVEAEQ